MTTVVSGPPRFPANWQTVQPSDSDGGAIGVSVGCLPQSDLPFEQHSEQPFSPGTWTVNRMPALTMETIVNKAVNCLAILLIED